MSFQYQFASGKILRAGEHDLTTLQMIRAQMITQDSPELLFLHALPLDGSMWVDQLGILPGATYAPTLYDLGVSVEEWAIEALKMVKGNRLIVVGCSVGGSCAVEVVIAAPERIAALVIIGTKVGHRPEPTLHTSTLELVQEKGLEEAWNRYWAPLFSKSAGSSVVAHAKSIALRQPPLSVARGITAFHTRQARDQLLSGFSFPVIVMTGAEDVAPGVERSAEQAEAAPRGRLHIVPECGHYVPLERPHYLNTVLCGVIAAQ